MNAQRVNKFELPFYEELVNVRAKRYQLLLDMYADVQRSAALMHDSEYCAWQRLLRPDEPCNCTAVHAGRLSFDGCQLPPVVPLPYLRYGQTVISLKDVRKQGRSWPGGPDPQPPQESLVRFS